MFTQFLNPAYLAAGAALISLPIIIHLINRMRFKRIRWAAMEFLLKSQKRNRRRLIIEQLILLALRCLLVLLAVLLVSRFLGLSFAGFELQNTIHVVILDDTPSMSDHWREEGDTRDCFRTAKELIVKEIAKNAKEARTAQRLVLLPLSETSRRPFDQRLNDQSIQDLEKSLADLECTALRTELAQGVEAAKEIFDKLPQDKRYLYVVSDFRQRDWTDPESARLNKALEDVGRSGVRINLVDAAHPFRNDMQRTPLFHDNLAIVDLQPETRIAARDLPVQFRVRVANHGISERKNIRVAVKVNGSERLEGSVNLNIRPGETPEGTFQIAFNELGFNQVSANLENEEVGLQIDNVRYAVVDVRKQVPVLIVDGDLSNGMKPGGDTYHLQTLLTVARGYQVFPRSVNELEQPSIDQYACIYILNVRDMSEKAVKNLENYVAAGGSVAFFMGERVRPEFYNERLYKKGKGLFPAPLADRPTPPMSDKELEPDMLDGQFKLFVRLENHPLFKEVWAPNYRPFFSFLAIRRYYSVPRRNWQFNPGEVEEVATLPNLRSMRDYAGEGQSILQSLDEPIKDSKYAKYRAGLESHQRRIRDTLLGDRPLYELARELESLLTDAGGKGDDQQPNLVEFWSQPEFQKLRGRIDKFRQDVQLGDPLVLTKNYERGRVVAVLTTAGTSWNDWAGGGMASETYPMVMIELQKFLTSGGGDSNRLVGSALDFDVDSGRYESKLRCFYQPEARASDPAKAGGNQHANNKNAGLVDKGEIMGADEKGRVRFVFDGARKSGLYRFELGLRSDKDVPGAKEGRIEHRAYVFNVDPAESDLRRAAREDLEKQAGGGKLRNPGSGWGTVLAEKQNDLSESAWFYLLFLVILVVEQALAVHLSFHLKGGEAQPAVTRPQMSAA
ncbi:MAG: hypothetical protein E6K70_00495 [Planctomycetota bacterium]|nr:MAG: hypothetical protein E6K70_00495 [Planctomycetota bacterium]